MTDNASTESDLEIAQPDDFFVTRDEDDKIQPITQPLSGVEEQIRVVPITIGDTTKYSDEDVDISS